MPPIETAARCQTVMYWPYQGEDNYGEPLYGTGREVTVRWTDVHRSVRDAKGNLVSVDAEIVTDFALTVGDFLWKGSQSEWVGTGSGSVIEDVMQVVSYDEIPDLKNRFIRRESNLGKYQGTLPVLQV